jgi:hypothetical protein
MLLNNIKTNNDVFEFIAKASIYGNLGLFVGAGLPMAILNVNNRIAMSWPELIKACCKKMEIDYDVIQKEGLSYPEISSNVCKQYQNNKKVEYHQAVSELKLQIAKTTSWYPEVKERKEYAAYFTSLNPSWIITTNYDTILESILTGKALSLGPNEYLVAQNGFVPVYHLHGIRTNPDSIIITQEDYVTLFRPNQYRQQKLPLTIKESVTVLLGYNMGDFNVLTAVDWSRHVFTDQEPAYPQEIIQFLYIQNPKITPYRDRNNIITVEFDDMSNILNELCNVIDIKVSEHKKRVENVAELNEWLRTCDEKMIIAFIDNKIYRKTILDILQEDSISLVPGFLELFSRSIEMTWERSNVSGAFNAYEENIKILLDILMNIEVKSMPPALLESVVYNLDRVSNYVGLNYGKSYSAYRYWKKYCIQIPKDSLEEIKNIVKARSYYSIKHLLADELF